MSPALPRVAVTAATALVLALGIVLMPRDECSASSVGGCIEVGANAFDRHVEVGESAALPKGEVRVDRAVATREIVTSVVSEETVTPPEGAAFVVVDYTATVADRARSVSATLHGSGLELRNTVRDAEVVPRTIPGIPQTGRMVFLVPDSVLGDDGLALEASWGSGDAARVSIGRLTVGPTVQSPEES